MLLIAGDVLDVRQLPESALQVGEAPKPENFPGICEAVVRAAMGDQLGLRL